MSYKELVIDVRSWTHKGLVQLGRALHAEGMEAPHWSQRRIAANHLVDIIEEIEARNGARQEELRAMAQQLGRVR